MSKTCYVKCADNKQARELRPHLVAVGFWEEAGWNRQRSLDHCTRVVIYYDKEAAIFSDMYETQIPLLHTIPPDADLSSEAKLIKELFEKQ